MFGASLNGIGNEQSLIAELGEDIRASLLASFDRVWKTATVL